MGTAHHARIEQVGGAHLTRLRRGTEVREQSEFATRWIKDTLPANFRGGVIFVDSPDPSHPKAHRLSRRRLYGISNDNKELYEKILDDLHNGSINIEQAAEVVRMHGTEHYIRVCITQDDLISTIDQILDSGEDCWGSDGKGAWDDHGYFVNTFWRE
ncbi:hypothetical protein [Paludisphaera soli]|uniref:hypothetical protein n=1 Tax=Paludisphaera soli TaxID=2712865 RepID=UPI0013EBE8D9|nr:hypothetical protein [Paludisphaera soli]